MVQFLAYKCQRSLTIGENPLSILSNNIRMKSAIFNGEMYYLINLPITPYQKLKQTVSSQVTYNGANRQFSSDFSISMIDFSFNINSNITNSSISIVQVSGSSTVNTNWTSDLGKLEYSVTVQNPLSVKYSEFFPTYIIVNCNVLSDDPYEREFVCPNNNLDRINCPANSKGFYNISCQGFHSIPVCKLWSYKKHYFSVSDACYLESFSSMNTTCRCTFHEGSYSVKLINQILSGRIGLFASHIITASEKVMFYPLQYVYSPFVLEKSSLDAKSASTIIVLYGSFVLVFFILIVYSMNNCQKNKVVPLMESKKKTRFISSYLPSIIPQELQIKSLFSSLKLRLASDNIYIIILKLKMNNSFDIIIYFSNLFGRCIQILLLYIVLVAIS
jgi:hypothetical protein